MADDNGAGGGLSPSGRFQRMEEALLRIEDKLDRKVGIKEFAYLEARVGVLESGETPMGKLLLKQFEDVQHTVADLRDRGSANAREAMALAHSLDLEVAHLRQEQTERAAVTKAARSAAGWRWRVFGAAVAFGELGLGLWVGLHS